MSNSSKPELELDEQVREEVMGLTHIRQRLDAIAEWIDTNSIHEGRVSHMVSRLSQEIDNLCNETTKCVQLHKDLHQLIQQLKEKESAIEQQDKSLSGIRTCIEHLDTHGKQLDDQARQLDSQRYQLDNQARQFNDQARLLDSQACQLDNQARQLNDQARQLNSQAYQVECISESNEMLGKLCKVIDDMKLEVTKPQDMINSRMELVNETVRTEIESRIGSVNDTVKTEIESTMQSVNDTVKTEIESRMQLVNDIVRTEIESRIGSVSDTVKTETASVNNILSSIQAKLTKDNSSQQIILNKLKDIENHVRLSQVENTQAITQPQHEATSQAESSSKLGSKRVRESYDSLLDLELLGIEDSKEDIEEWRKLFSPIRAAFSISVPDMKNSDVTLKRMRRMILVCLSYSSRSPERFMDFLEDDSLIGKWVCMAAICDRDQIFEPDENFCEDCSGENSKTCLRVKKERSERITLRMISWDS
ncbi:hypothetical protein F4824DRAFT_511042 [Ustulina deusta]|nr:hypothetical protein F4824DRAFT_511042 [Ustulina deusta]